MYVVHIAVRIDPSRTDDAARYLHERVVPDAKQAPGFQRGLWTGDGATKGRAVMTFDSQANAERVASMVGAADDDPVSVESVEVMWVQAEA